MSVEHTLEEQLALHAECPLSDAMEMLDSPPMQALRERCLIAFTVHDLAHLPEAVRRWLLGTKFTFQTAVPKLTIGEQLTIPTTSKETTNS